MPSDADVLERAAEIIRRDSVRIYGDLAYGLRQYAAKLRQPAPDAKES